VGGAGGAGAGGAGAAGAGAGGAGAGGTRGGGFGIQLGAFSSEAAANNEWRLLTGRFGLELQGLNEHVVTADTPSGRVYRLQAVVGDEARARAICDSLRKRSQECVAVLPH
jgi:cell division septation protein DedD